MSRRARHLGVVAFFVLCVLIGWPPVTPAPGAAAQPSTHAHIPVYAYFYQWYTPSSWRRAKIDYPLIGKYSSDDPQVLRQQVAEAQGAGLDGFLTSWKSTPRLNSRLRMLLKIARPRHFDVGVVYEGLDFQRHPLPISVVRSDLTTLVARWGKALRSRYFHSPVVVWTGMDQFSVADVRSVRRALGDQVLLLASAKNVPEYQRISSLVDGDAYYWSSENPGTTYTQDRLAAISRTVHDHHGIWIAPATAGFDGHPLGHIRVIPRDGGRTLIRSLGDAFASSPQAVGVISWNEWSENTYIEPGQRYGTQELDALRGHLQPLRGGRATAVPPTVAPTVRANTAATPRSAAIGADSSGWTGLRAGLVLALGSCLGAGLLTLRVYARRPSRRKRYSPPRHIRRVRL